MAAKRKHKGCIVCGGPFGVRDLFMCDPCSLSFDKNAVNTTIGVIEWAAKRALWCKRKKR